MLLLVAIACWWIAGGGPESVALALLVALLLTRWLESAMPAHPGWRMSGWRWLSLVVAVAALAVWFGILNAMHSLWLEASFDRVGLREAPDSALWPLYALALFFGADLIYYAVHRSIHRYRWLWRASGHAVHHGFHRLNAVHAGLTHPFEVIALSFPMAFLGVVTAAPAEVVAAASVLIGTNAIVVHANLDLDTPGMRWFVTTSNQHRIHHSLDPAQRESNFACNAIVWDRVFGTYRDGSARATGLGRHETGFRESLTLPFRS
jgi:sterol desaturase/sphingolipid hydroxylase (fatty acid hydroxylase superfamily)